MNLWPFFFIVTYLNCCVNFTTCQLLIEWVEVAECLESPQPLGRLSVRPTSESCSCRFQICYSSHVTSPAAPADLIPDREVNPELLAGKNSFFNCRSHLIVSCTLSSSWSFQTVTLCQTWKWRRENEGIVIITERQFPSCSSPAALSAMTDERRREKLIFVWIKTRSDSLKKWIRTIKMQTNTAQACADRTESASYELSTSLFPIPVCLHISIFCSLIRQLLSGWTHTLAHKHTFTCTRRLAAGVATSCLFVCCGWRRRRRFLFFNWRSRLVFISITQRHVKSRIVVEC